MLNRWHRFFFKDKIIFKYKQKNMLTLIYLRTMQMQFYISVDQKLKKPIESQRRLYNLKATAIYYGRMACQD